jgi:cardiolipin synthase
LRRALVRAAKMGVDVRVLTTGESDVPGTVWAGKYVMGVMLKHGVRVYELSPEHYLHAKLFTADGRYSTVGSFNFDFLSTHRNLEVVVATHDGTFATDVERHFERLTKSARRVKRDELSVRTVPERVLHWFSYQFAKLWRRFNFFEERQ